MAQLNIRIDDEIKLKAEETCKDIGISLSAAINMYLKRLGEDGQIPIELTSSIRKKDLELKKDILFIYPLVENGTLSHGKAAKALGLSKWEFIEELADLGIPYLSYDTSEVEKDLDTWKKIKNKIQ